MKSACYSSVNENGISVSVFVDCITMTLDVIPRRDEFEEVQKMSKRDEELVLLSC